MRKQPLDNKQERKRSALWGLDFNKFFNSASLALAIYALFEVISNPELKLERDEPLRFVSPLDVNEHLQASLICFVLTILFASAGLFMDLLARGRLEREPEEVKEMVLSLEGPFDNWMNWLTVPAIVFAAFGLGFRLGAIHVWYSRGFIGFAIILIIVLERALKVLTKEADRAADALQPEVIKQTSLLEVGGALLTGLVITVIGLVGSIGRRR